MVRFFAALRGQSDTPAPANPALETKSNPGISWPGATVHRGWTSWSGPNRAAGWDMDQVIAEGFERSVWAYRCVELISGSQSRLPFRIARNRGLEDEEIIEKHPLYRVLNKRANPLETARAFRKRLSAQVLLSKKGAFVEVIKSRAGIITRLDLLDPDRVEIIPSDNGDYIDYFQYTRRDGRVVELAPERVRWIREPHPTDPFCGTTPLEAAGISVELDQLARMYNVSFIKNDSRPGGILSVDTESLTDQEMDRLERRFAPGAGHAGHLSVVASGHGGLNYVDVAARPRDMNYGELAERAKDEILSAFGIGESVLGNASGRTFDNAEQEEYNFWTKPMPPHNDLIASAFAEDIDEDLEPFLDTSGVDALEVGQRRRRDEARSEVEAGLRSIDEYRPLAGLEALNNPQARALWISPNKAPVPGDPRDAQTLLGGEAVGGGGEPMPPADGGAPAGPDGAPSGTGPTTAAEVVEAARAEGADLADMSIPTGAAAAAVDAARAEQTLMPAEGPGAAAVANARAEGGPWSPAAPPPADPAVTAEGEVEPGPAHRAVESALWGLEEKAITTEQAAIEYEPVAALSDAAALALNAALSPLLARQEGVILARLESPKARRGTPFWRAEYENDTRAGDAPIDVEKVVDAERWVNEAAATLSPVVQDASAEASTQFLAALIAAGALDAEADPARLERVAGTITRATSLAALTALLDAILDHLTRLIGAVNLAQMRADDVSELAAVVREHFAGKSGEARWSRTLAGDVGHGIVTGATEQTAQHLAQPDARPIVREWVSRRDERVRITHREVDGTVLPAGQPFQVGADLMMYPQEPTASPQERYGCRCRCVYRIEPGETLTLPA